MTLYPSRDDFPEAPTLPDAKDFSALSLRVMVVDDDSAIAEVMADILRMDGYQVRVLIDSREALMRAATWQPHVILLDYMMPGLDGATFVRELREQGNDARVVLVTASGLGPSVAEFLGVDFLAKPFDLDTLRTQIEPGRDRN